VKSILTAVLFTPLLAGQHHGWTFEDHQTIEKSFQVATGENASKLIVDNMAGHIRVTGGSGSQIHIKAEKNLWAETQADLDRAKQEVTIEMTQDGNTVKTYEDGPFRHRDGIDWDSNRQRYDLRCDYEIEVPAGVQVELKDLSGGIDVKNVNGSYNVHTLSGPVQMEGIGGSGTVKTLSGKVSVTYTRNPAKDANFDTLSGSIDVYFPKPLDADLAFHTLSGGIYSDFEVTSQPSVIQSNGGTRYVYRRDRDMKVRAGKGGTALSFRTLSGAIRLHSKTA